MHQYANLYFDPRNPMLSKRRNQNEEICILKFNRAILDLEGVILSDRNASSKYVKFYRVKDGLEKINFDLVYAKYWTDSDYLNQSIKKSIKCAEVLVPYCIPFNYVVCAAVVSRNSENKLKAVGFNKSIFIKPEIFFRSW